MDDHAHEVVHVEEEYNLCKVIPLSRATPNDTGIDNGEITAFSTLFFVRVHGIEGLERGSCMMVVTLGCVGFNFACLRLF